MTVSTWILSACLAIAGAVDGGVPSALVAKLGSGQFAEREAAARGLEGLGAEALAALRAARFDRDPEVRTRAMIVLDRIETRLLVRPTLVAIDADDRPVAEVLRDLGAKTGMPPTLDPEDPAGPGRRVTIRPKPAVPYWSAIDQICASAGLRSTQAPQGLGGQGGSPILLYPAGGAAPTAAPTSDSGPFRVKLVKLDYHRERQLEAEPGAPGAAGTRHRFSARLIVQAEPRLMLAQAGPARVSEAVDDLGRSLLMGSSAALADDAEAEAIEAGLGGPFPVTISLGYPEPAGRSIRRLKGSIPVAVAARKAGPLVIGLDGAVGKTFHSPEVSVTIEAIRSDPNEPQSSVELTVRPAGPGGSIAEPGPRRIGLGGGDFFDKQVEVLDRDGRPFLLFPQDAGPKGDGFRVVLVLAPVEGGVKPATLRFHGLARASAEIPFEFGDVSW